MAVALETVVKQLEDSGIVAAGKLEQFVPPKAHPTSAEELVRELVKQNHLTRFQAAQVAAGRAKSLLLGEYTILDKIGAGGMGQVFKALHRRMDRTVAIKTLPPAMTKDAPAVARFEREVRAAAKLSHPNIVAAHDAGHANGVHFLVMEYVEGSDLSALVKKNGPFSVAKATNYILQAARGLEFAHGEGVVHRDIKPANLLVDKKGVVKILDMGLARIASEADAATQAELTGTGAIMGTVDFMAPEQALSTKHADARADIYSLGCSLFYLLTGKPTYDGETITAKLIAHQAHPIPELRQVCGEASEELEAVFNRMMAKQVEDRYQSMSEVVAALERLFAGQLSASSAQTAGSTDTKNSALTCVTDISDQPTIQKAKATTKLAAAKSGDGKPPWKNTKVLIGAVVLGVLILAGIIVSLQTKDGTLIVEVDQPDAIVQVLDAEGKVEVSQKGGGGKVTISVDPGKHRLRVEKEGFTVYGQEFEIESAGEKSIMAKLVKQVAVTAQPNKPWNTPDFQTWMKSVAVMSAEEQFKAVVQKLHELNPEYKSVYPPKYSQESGNVTEFILRAVSGLNDLSPLRALPGLKTVGLGQCVPFSDLSALQGLSLVSLYIDGTQVADLSPLKGMPLEVLTLPSLATDISPLKGMPLNTLSMFHTRATSLSALQGMKLTRLEFDNCRIDDLSPLSGMPLTFLTCSRSQVVDLSPLKGMPLVNLHCGATPISNLSPLEDCQTLATLNVTATKVTPASIAALQNALPNCKIEWDDPAKATTPPAATNGLAPLLAKAPFDAAGAKVHQEAWAKYFGTQVETTNSVGQTMILIPPGEFLMGSTDADVEEALKVADEIKSDQATKIQIQRTERPQHKVAITRPFLISATEVTVGQFKKFSAEGFVTEAEKEAEDGNAQTYLNTGYDLTEDFPVTVITWNDAVAYCKWLSDKEKRTYRLPTEAEWEYACRAGTTTQYSFGDDYNELPKYGWHSKNANGHAHPVGALLPNNFGLFDMHGNLWEWCGDYWDEKWYVKSLPNDSIGPSFGSNRVIRGGNWYFEASCCRSSFRSNLDPSPFPNHSNGFRCVAELSAPLVIAPTSSAESSKLFMHDPAFRQWTKDVAAMPAEKQVEAVSKKLMELNPGFDGVVTPKVVNGTVKQFTFFTDHVIDISPVRAFVELTHLTCPSNSRNGLLTDLSPLQGMQLTVFNCGQTQVSDLLPLKGMPLTHLFCSGTQVSDLAPLRGMPLQIIECSKSKITDLSPLEGMKLTRLWCNEIQISDLSPLRGMPLDNLNCSVTQVADLSPLQGMPLTGLDFHETPVSDLSPLRGMPLMLLLCKGTHVTDFSPLKDIPLKDLRFDYRLLSDIETIRTIKTLEQINFKPVAEFWKDVELQRASFAEWMKDVAARSAEQQVDMVVKKLQELNPEFDGKVMDLPHATGPTIEQGVVTGLRLSTDKVTDISPLKALTGLTRLWIHGSSPGKSAFFDLRSLEGLELTELNCGQSPALADLSPLEGMPLQSLLMCDTKVSDLSPLKGMPLKSIAVIRTKVSDLAPLEGMSLEGIEANETLVSDLSPIKDMPLNNLQINSTNVSDLSPIKDMPLKRIGLDFKPERDTELLRSIKTLEKINDKPVDEFWKDVEAQQAAFDKWTKDVQAMPADQQVEAVSKKLVEMNPGFDGKVTPTIENGMVTGLAFVVDNVTDISPVRALPELNTLKCHGHSTNTGKLADLSPLKGMKLRSLNCGWSPSITDLSPLEGMALTWLSCRGTSASDLSLLATMPLTELHCDFNPAQDLATLRSIKTLESINGKQVADFWKEVEEQQRGK